jgi:DNA-binding Lrp family transcriptional regulator
MTNAVPTQRSSAEASGPVPTPRMHDVLTDSKISSTAKVVYMFLDELGRGAPVAIQQTDIAEALSITRETVSSRIADLRTRGYVGVSVYISDEGRRINTYRTRLHADLRPKPLVYSG